LIFQGFFALNPLQNTEKWYKMWLKVVESGAYVVESGKSQGRP
jgi:hypothetical protein